MKNPLEEAIDEIKDYQEFLLGGGIPCDRTESLVAAIRRALKEDEFSDALESQLAEFLFMLGRVAFACHSSVYTTIALLHRNITPRRPMGDMEKCDPPNIEEVAIALPRILETLSAEWLLLPPSAAQPDFSDIESAYEEAPFSPVNPEEASAREECKAQACYARDFCHFLTEENVSKILTQLTRSAEAFKADQPPRVDEEDSIDFGLFARMVEQLAELSYDRWLKHGSVKRVYVNTPELERQKLIIEQTMALVDAIRDYVGHRKSSCAADLMKLETMLNSQEDGVHQVGFADALKALMDALWRESVTPEKPVVVVGDGRATPGPKMSSAKRDQQSMGVRDIQNGRFKTPAAAAAHIVQLALPQWKDEGYTEKNRASLAQAIRRALAAAKRSQKHSKSRR